MSDILTKWDSSLSATQFARLDRNLSRRDFLAHTGKAMLGLSLLPSSLAISSCQTSSHPWDTFAAVQQILFPDDGNGPSAKQINATAYLQFVLSAPDTDKEDSAFILNGINWLNKLAQDTLQADFIQLTVAQQEKTIQTISQSQAGDRWLSYLLLYIVEALLSAPAYGGNPNGVGWQWLAHQPGYPHPPIDKIYTKLP